MGDNKNSGQFPIQGFAVIMLALGVLILTDSPFKNTRPKVSDNLTTESETVLARLWQDPFEAVQLHKKNPHNKNESDHSLANLKQKIKNNFKFNKDKNYDLHILAVMVSGGPYAENKENRIRSRYAVTTGLSSIGYLPGDSTHINYLNLSASCTSTNEKHCGWPQVIPYEWFKPRELSTKWDDYGFSKNILVLWIDEESISKKSPLNNLANLKNSLIKKTLSKKSNEQARIKFDIIGPASSSTLINMYKNLAQSCSNSEKNCEHIKNQYGEKGIRVYSPRATLNDDSITTILQNQNIKNIINFPGLHRTIANDSMLVDNLLCEMLSRGINPFGKKQYLEKNSFHIHMSDKMQQCSNFSIASLNKHGRQDYIVLIGEWDTIYSRNFNKLFRDTIRKQINSEKVKSINWVLNFNFLRGLDGEIGNKRKSDKKNTKKSSNKDGEKVFRRPVGANQFDYLRRLASQIAALEKRLKSKGSIRAIGIMGSDTYDKLLILQALRNNFPGTLFFTTNLDARLLHNEENKWTRNLVVASTFGLSPKTKYQIYKGLDFRDSYQTALYNTVQLATFECNNESKKDYKKCKNYSVSPEDLVIAASDNSVISSKSEIQPVKIFEIGNNSAVDYSHYNKCGSRFNTGEFCDINQNIISYKVILYLFLSLTLITILTLQTNNKTRFYILSISTIIFSIVVWLYFYRSVENRELYAMFTGTSIWPAYIIRMTAFICSLIFIAYAIVNLKSNSIYIIQKNSLSEKKCTSLLDRIRNKLKKSDSISLKKYLLIIPQAIRWYCLYDCYDTNTINKKSLIKPDATACILITSWGWKDKLNTEISIENLFYQYMELSKSRWWILRVLTLSTLYVIFSYYLVESFHNMPIAPFSGKISAHNMFTLMNAVYLPYIFLVFYVSDITRVNSRFVELLSKYSISWPEETLKKCCIKYGLSKDIAIEKLKLDLIIVRSKIVDKLIFLPFIILTLMILSKSNYFDRWYTPPQLAFVILLGAFITVSSAIRLRKAARHARKNTLKILKDTYKQQKYKEVNTKLLTEDDTGVTSLNMSERIKDLIIDIENITTGPFSPITKHPIISAVAMPFGGVGSLYLIEYFSSAGI
jgi:hypothetical protein